MTCLRRRGFWFTYKRSLGVNKCASRIEGVTPHNVAYIASFRDVPVGSLFVVNTLENIQIFQSLRDYSANSTLINGFV